MNAVRWWLVVGWLGLLAGAVGQPKLRLETGHLNMAAVGSARLSADGATILTTWSEESVRIWDAATGRVLRQLSDDTGGVNGASFSPDGQQVVTASNDHSARLWDVATGREIRRFVGHQGAVNSASFSTDGRLVLTASDDMTARIWDAITGREIRHLKGDQGGVHLASLSTDGRFVVTRAAIRHGCGTWPGAASFADLAGKERRS